MSIGHFANASSAAASGGGPPPSSSWVDQINSLAPVNWWRLNESSGLVAADDGSANQDLIYPQDAGTVGYDEPPLSAFTGVGSRSKRFDASADGLVDLIDDTTGKLNVTAATIEFALEYNAGSGFGSSYLFGYNDLGGGNLSQWRVATVKGTPDILQFIIHDGIGGFVIFQIDTDIDALIGADAFISITYSSTTNILNTRVNGVQTTNLSTSAITMYTGVGGAFSIGVFPSGTGDGQDALLDEIMIYNKILTDDERNENYAIWSTGLSANTGIGATQAAAIANAYPTPVELDGQSELIASVPAGEWAAWPLAASVLANAANLGNTGTTMSGSGDQVAVEIWADVGAGVVLFAAGTPGAAGVGTDILFDASTFITGFILVKNNEATANTLQSSVLAD